ncbi:Hypp1662 [Branchiostoma lanceolatum]|uniref:Hypp1662 protein n=1 Tax=Branchiostoma lanceolatum TaxID=7740 RepID=A0A8J9ZKW5_BRALA|nr:Hypp1662 [Branchiostoma lanceolatum]
MDIAQYEEDITPFIGQKVDSLKLGMSSLAELASTALRSQRRNTWPTSALPAVRTEEGELAYLTTWDGWGFYKVKAVGNMTNTNVKATCEAAGMRLPCFYTGHGRCTLWWTSDCIAFDHDELDCRTPLVLSTKMCVTIFPHNCERLDDTFVYMPGWHGGDTAWGVDYDTNSWALLGAHYSDKYALCAVESPNNVITG